ncbi:MAG: recombinase family protein [Gaiellaceae bacterium]
MNRRAIGIVRVSRTKGEGIVSPDEQRQRIVDACQRDGLKLLDVVEELDVSGGAALEKRPGLSKAVAKIEAGSADVIVVAYFDRLDRSTVVQAELVTRVEAAGGAILAVDVGQVTNGSAGQWLSGSMLGLVAEYQRRTTAERTEESKRRAIARGVPTFDRIPAGYRKRKDGTLEPDPVEAPLMAEAFRMRASGASIQQVREYLNVHGIKGGYTRFQKALESRIYLGELRFGEYLNTASHEPIIDRLTWERVQARKKIRGSREKSDRLLARLGILRCGTCGAKLVVGQQHSNGKRYDFYRCIPQSDCPQRVTIGADRIESYLTDYLFALAPNDRPFTMSREAQSDDAGLERELLEAEQELQGYLVLTKAIDPRLAQEGLELRQARVDAAQQAVAESVPALPFSGFEIPEGLEDEFKVLDGGSGLELRGTAIHGLWEKLPVEGKRMVLSRLIESVTVSPGRTPVEERVKVQLRKDEL